MPWRASARRCASALSMRILLGGASVNEGMIYISCSATPSPTLRTGGGRGKNHHDLDRSSRRSPARPLPRAIDSTIVSKWLR
eukprot:5746052-Pyramimonas_sp.AAC.1